MNIRVFNTMLMHSLCLLFLTACRNKVEELKRGDYILKGNIKLVNDDTLLEGPINYFKADGKLVSTINYKDKRMDGLYQSYYANGMVQLESHYTCDMEHGESKVFDSTGKLTYKSNYFFGREFGGTYNFKNDSIASYRFLSFDGWELYSCRYGNDSAGAIIENGNLLNYTTTYKDVDDIEKIELFMYLINPPHKQITFRIYDVDLQKADSTLVIEIPVFKYQDQFKILYLNRLGENHKYAVQGEAYYPKEKVTIKDILNQQEKELNLPQARH